jgi:hypothetical protein
MHVRDHHGFAACGRRAAHAAADRDAHAGGLALERAEQQVAALRLDEVEARPVELRQAPVQQRHEVRRIGDEVVLAREQGARADLEFGVCGCLVRRQIDQLVHEEVSPLDAQARSAG